MFYLPLHEPVCSAGQGEDPSKCPQVAARNRNLYSNTFGIWARHFALLRFPCGFFSSSILFFLKCKERIGVVLFAT